MQTSRLGVAAAGAAAWALLLLVLAACGGADNTPEGGNPGTAPTPASAPTERPSAGFQPITAQLPEDAAAFFAAIPAFERNCLVLAVGTPRFDEIAAGDDPTQDEGERLLGCVSGATAGRIVAGSLINASDLGSLSPDTLDCMAPRFARLTPSDLADDLVALARGDVLKDLSALSGKGLAPLLDGLSCLDDRERAAVNASLGGALSARSPPTP